MKNKFLPTLTIIGSSTITPGSSTEYETGGSGSGDAPDADFFWDEGDCGKGWYDWDGNYYGNGSSPNPDWSGAADMNVADDIPSVTDIILDVPDSTEF